VATDHRHRQPPLADPHHAKRPIAKESLFEVGQLATKVSQFRDVLQDPDIDARLLAREFYDAIIGPVAESLKQAKARTIMFSLDSQLRYLPIAALYDG